MILDVNQIIYFKIRFGIIKIMIWFWYDFTVKKDLLSDFIWRYFHLYKGVMILLRKNNIVFTVWVLYVDIYVQAM